MEQNEKNKWRYINLATENLETSFLADEIDKESKINTAISFLQMLSEDSSLTEEIRMRMYSLFALCFSYKGDWVKTEEYFNKIATHKSFWFNIVYSRLKLQELQVVDDEISRISMGQIELDNDNWMKLDNLAETSKAKAQIAINACTKAANSYQKYCNTQKYFSSEKLIFNVFLCFDISNWMSRRNILKREICTILLATPWSKILYSSNSSKDKYTKDFVEQFSEILNTQINTLNLVNK